MVELKKYYRLIPAENKKQSQYFNKYRTKFKSIYETCVASDDQDPRHINLSTAGNNDKLKNAYQQINSDENYLPPVNVWSPAEIEIILNVRSIFNDFSGKKILKDPNKPWNRETNPLFYRPEYKAWKAKYFPAYQEWAKKHPNVNTWSLAKSEYVDEMEEGDMDYSSAMFSDYDFDHHGMYSLIVRDSPAIFAE